MSEVERQNEFVRALVKLLSWLDENGYQVTLGEAYRPIEMARIYAQQGKGILASLHCQRLAIDLNIFKSEVLLMTVPDLRPVGEYWKSLSREDFPFIWGGDFLPKPDSDHYSLETNGVK